MGSCCTQFKSVWPNAITDFGCPTTSWYGPCWGDALYCDFSCGPFGTVKGSGSNFVLQITGMASAVLQGEGQNAKQSNFACLGFAQGLECAVVDEEEAAH